MKLIDENALSAYLDKVKTDIMAMLVTDVTKTYRYTFAQHLYKMNASGFTIGQPVMSIPDLKGKLPLPYTGPAVPTLSGKPPIYTKEGILFFQNEAGIQYQAQSSAKAPYPMEIWMVILKLITSCLRHFAKVGALQYTLVN